MATTTPSLPDQQEAQPQQVLPSNTAASSNSAWQSSGSIGPFFAVISVLAVLVVLSCVAGRFWGGQDRSTPLDSIKHRDCFGWLKRIRGKGCIGCGGDAEVGVKGMVAGDKSHTDAKAQGEV
ncbi:hypothetical protein NMG60_11024005 [Bertholletia excelsa]